MNFAKNLVEEESVTTASGLSFLEMPPSSSDIPFIGATKENIEHGETEMRSHVNNLLISSANKAASDIFLSTGSKLYSTIKAPPSSSKDPHTRTNVYNLLVDCKLYSSKILPPSSSIKSNDLVVVFESFDSLDFVYVKSGDVFHNRNGHFHHDDFIGKPYGCKIRSRNNRGLGFVYLLRPTPELWARSLNHRTQIVHELDSAMVVFNLNLRPNMTVCESGTGSGAMSHCIMRAIAPHGILHTYEFNKMRAKTATEEFRRNGVNHLVKVHWRDVCGKPIKAESGNDERKAEGEGRELSFGSGGFKIGQAAAHAIFLDLPEPWLAIPHAAHTIKPNGSLCSYSPCMEQTQKTSQAMREYGFHSIKTIEVRLREHYVDRVELDNVPTTKLARDINIGNYVPGMPAPSQRASEHHRKYTLTQVTKPIADTNEKELPGDVPIISSKKRKLLCARPFSSMRGHSAFLTFANAGNQARPQPR